MIGYFLERGNMRGRLFCGTSPESVANTISNEIDIEEELPIDERDTFTITPVEITQDEIDAMPEFPGW